jgi:hypothetical protein
MRRDDITEIRPMAKGRKDASAQKGSTLGILIKRPEERR